MEQARPHRWLGPVLVLAGLLAVQLAWIASLPAFRGLDEHDHVYRADAVAAGDWVSTGRTTELSRGELVSVRRSVVEAAGPICDVWPYTEHYDCHPAADDGPDRALVASAAARYHPAFYWVVGSVAGPFEGTAAVYAMRVATAVLCALLVAVAFSALQTLSEARWRLAALLVVLTPTMTYSTAVTAPNGVEMAAALLSWAALLALLRSPAGDRPPPWLVAAAATGLVVLSTVRSLGPLWALLIVAAVVAASPRERLRTLVRTHPRPVALVGAAWLVASAAGAAWTLLNGTNDPASEEASFEGSAWGQLPRQLVLWALQSVGAFPARDVRAPVVVYALFAVITAALLWWGIREAPRRTRWVMTGILVAVVLISAAITVVTFPAVGLAWQGRYGWPLSMGVPLLAGLSVSRGPSRKAWLVLITVLAAAATAVSQVGVYRREVRNDALPDDWTLVPAPVLVVLTVIGFALLLAADLHRRPGSRQGSGR